MLLAIVVDGAEGPVGASVDVVDVAEMVGCGRCMTSYLCRKPGKLKSAMSDFRDGPYIAPAPDK